jgi:hypothetical protein
MTDCQVGNALVAAALCVQDGEMVAWKWGEGAGGKAFVMQGKRMKGAADPSLACHLMAEHNTTYYLNINGVNE